MKLSVLGKLFLIILSTAIVVSIFLIGCTTRHRLLPAFCTLSTIDTQFTAVGGQVYRLNIYATKGQIIEGSWKSDIPVYRWWTAPGGAAYPLEDYSNPRILGVAEPYPLHPEPGFYELAREGDMVWATGSKGDETITSMVGLTGCTISIKCTESGYYSICFMPYPYDTKESANILVHYTISD
jgi:hypothetical protein